MTSTTGRADTTQHPDVSEISDLTEGLLPPARTAAVRRHVDGCALCADVRASLEEIRGLLGTLPGPVRMPAEIAGRIDAALAAEALLSATTPDDATAHVSRETPSDAPEALPAAEDSPDPAGAADRPAGRPRAATGPGRPTGRRRRRVAVLGGILGAAALGLGTFLLLPGTLQNAADSSGDKKSDVAASAADTPFSDEGIDQRVQELLRADGTRKAPKDAPESLTAENDGNTPLRSADATLPNCVRAGTDRTDPVLAFQPGDYQGSRAYLVVLPHATDPSKVQAYVLDASCTEGGGSAKADVLLTHVYPRP
ncbi:MULTISPECIES: hypothetical protein [Streptomyces]|uniref:Zinc-finger domain-containing protein n=1 Tax=Streptomyces solicathayae TaxID=3081768 RepID=A0ABZ0LUT2_9ACTN|nr:hypothetical protein [Streptomyces sp. HUAS YS2]WOX23262.1 hypothetical protein R2D22_18430 [Streptomyces sp. HUAS YS2]